MPGPNRLIDEKSPYLLQHAHNPVDWYPWGEAAFSKARAEDRPIFLSIGYSTCHWCHVMERESFESEEVAAVLNRHFIPIKVDREERPDVDRIYMTFVQATTQGGGWPMSVWLTPDLKPFFGGTYFPPDNRYGRPGFKAILEYIAQAWLSDRAKILDSAHDVLDQLRRQAEVRSPSSASIDPAVLDSCFAVFRRVFDPVLGGFGGPPKFPRPVTHNFLLRHHHLTGNREALDMVLLTLREMAKGGMNDQLGGGFHRYSVDERWFVPHFEKMLYDQAQLATSYLEAFQITGEPDLAHTARDIFEYVLRDLTHPGGAFYSAEDADSVIDPAEPHHKGEGAFYIWSQAELESLLHQPLASWFAYRYGALPKGNVAHDPQGEFTGRNILYQLRTITETARYFQISEEELARALDQARATLLAARALRPRPHLDDKVLASWNGLMISAFTLGGLVLDEPRYLDAAARAANFIRAHMLSGRALSRRHRDGSTAIPGFLDDYAFFATALLDLSEAFLDPGYLAAAIDLAEEMLVRFEDRENGGFFSTSGDDPSLVLRLKDDYDGAEPSGNSAAALLLARLAAVTQRDDFRSAAQRAIGAFASRLQAAPHATPQLLIAHQFLNAPQRQIVLSGDPAAPATRAMLRELYRRFLPFKVVLPHAPALLPHTAPMAPLNGHTTAFVCEDFSCRLPTTELTQFTTLIST